MVSLTVANSSPMRLSSSPKIPFFHTRKPSKKHPSSSFPVARLFGPAIFEASKLKVLFLGVDEHKYPENIPRTYTLTHSDITSKITLAISQTINNSQLQGWCNRIQRDEVIAEWKKVKGNMSLHVHCHISGGHFLLDLFAPLRYYVFCKELPVVLEAFVHGDMNLFRNYPELKESMVWVYFHSNISEFNKVECWGELAGGIHRRKESPMKWEWSEVPNPCQEDCNCCFPSVMTSMNGGIIPWPHSHINPAGLAGEGEIHRRSLN
ncbi:protein STAY-GREEN homolog, chloroplastic-like [Impatiens glandulifera]|uniref:protein STAY-GREEN homolog, chloroplastic-like n=1 Tax=Impatiens glandulifera TaxID=253017 RepID=UPI001FB10AA7|nr:protein STAY-GREEN homolog, chloroplastic-like [Impatiens glandulifera]